MRSLPIAEYHRQLRRVAWARGTRITRHLRFVQHAAVDLVFESANLRASDPIAQVESSGLAHRIVRGMPSKEPVQLYQTDRGEAWLGDAIETLQEHCADESVDLIVTSPPSALSRPKEYGNQSQDTYMAWFLPFADQLWRVLKPKEAL